MDVTELDKRCVTALRMLAVDAVERANSGHPGMPLGAAPMAYVLWTRIMRHHPGQPDWPNRDRLVLSAGHGSALLYALLHLSGYDLTLDDLRQFRQLGSRTPGHPEYGHTPGVEATTGPLGQGLAMAVGMALAEARLVREYGEELCGHHTYAIVSDGDLMEGVVAEAVSLAGHWRLGRLVVLYDDNRITIEGSTDLAFTEDVTLRFEACGWRVLVVASGEDLGAIESALTLARQDDARPTLIRVATVIGQGSPKAGTSGIHGSPLVGEAMSETRRHFGWSEERFQVPEAVRDHFAGGMAAGILQARRWQSALEAWQERDPVASARFLGRLRRELPEGWDRELMQLSWGVGQSVATRVVSGRCLNALAPGLPALIGGSADLAPSNNTDLHGDAERTLHFGVREHAMGAILNGMALHGGFIPFGGTFLVFADYLRPSIRLAAMMQTGVIYVFTHDSIAVGEDGPTHQPVEQLASLRAIPGLTVMRPADAGETVAAWRWAVGHPGPVALILTRQNLPVMAPVEAAVGRGGYVLAEAASGVPEVVLMASGSEVALVMQARLRLEEAGVATRVVSMPCRELFAAQDAAYRESVVPAALSARLVVEAGVSLGWYRYAGDRGRLMTLDRFGLSGPGEAVQRALGFTVEAVVQTARELVRS